jgi:predicted membrane-bound spermidine synthase
MATEKRFTRAPDVEHTRTDVVAVLSAVAGGLAVAAFFAPWFGVIYAAIVLAVVGLVLGLRSRARLQADPTLGGAGLSAFGFLASIVVLVVRLPVLVIDIAAALGLR